MDTRINISLEKKRAQRLQTIALRYGLSLKELATRVLEQVTDEIPEESITPFRNRRSLRTSLDRALEDAKHGRVSTTL